MSVMTTLNFQQSLFQTSVSHDPSEIILICWFGAQETIIAVINVGGWGVVILGFLMNRKSKNKYNYLFLNRNIL